MSKHEIVAIREDFGLNAGFFWGVKEIQTDQVINTFFFYDDAEEYLAFLEEGGAFDGFTPSFILNAIKVNESLDETFARKFDVT